jgi:hypothetical protein
MPFYGEEMREDVGEEDSYKWGPYVSDPDRDYIFPGTPNRFRVQIRPGLRRLECQFQRLRVEGLI